MLLLAVHRWCLRERMPTVRVQVAIGEKAANTTFFFFTRQPMPRISHFNHGHLCWQGARPAFTPTATANTTTVVSPQRRGNRGK